MFCQHCGQQLPEATAYCSSCGKPIDDTPPSATEPPPGLPAVAGQAALPPSVVAPTQTLYAGFWLRVVAHIIDSFIIVATMFVVLMVAALVLAGGAIAAGEENPENNPMGILLALMTYPLMFIPPWLYFAYMESSSWQATVGKRALGLIVTDINGQPITFWRATGRYFGRLLSNMTLGIGYAMAGFTDKKQALHDMIADCLVLRRQ